MNTTGISTRKADGIITRQNRTDGWENHYYVITEAIKAGWTEITRADLRHVRSDIDFLAIDAAAYLTSLLPAGSGLAFLWDGRTLELTGPVQS
jgi:hypothetical protein